MYLVCHVDRSRKQDLGMELEERVRQGGGQVRRSVTQCQGPEANSF